MVVIGPGTQTRIGGSVTAGGELNPLGKKGASKGAPAQRVRHSKGKGRVRGKAKPKRAVDFNLGNRKHVARLERIAEARGVLNPKGLNIWRNQRGQILIWDKLRSAAIVLAE